MNTNEIENLLRDAPVPNTPPGLRAKLQSQIEIPPAKQEYRNTIHLTWFQRYGWPVALAASGVVCVGALAIQSRQIAALQEQNLSIEQKLAGQATPMVGENPGASRQYQLDRLEKDYAEVLKLREEVANLRKGMESAALLKADNERLKSVLQTAAQAEQPASNVDFFEQEKGRAQSNLCINHLKQLGVAVRLYAHDHKDKYPPNLEAAKNEITSEKIMRCPSGESYHTYLREEPLEDTPQAVLFRCSVHGNVGLADGSAHTKVDPDRIELRNGYPFMK